MAIITKPRNSRSKRFLEKREPQVLEGTKIAIFLKNTTANELVNSALHDLILLKKPDAILYHKKNDLKLFEDEASLDFFSKKSDASLFAVGYHSKKRPNTILMGRTFDFQILDMIELHIEEYQSIDSLKSSICNLGRKPLFIFQGEAFEQGEVYQKLKNLFVDFFGGNIGMPKAVLANPQFETLAAKVHLEGIEHVLSISADSSAEKIYFRVYKIKLLQSCDGGSKLPRVELESIGPFMTFKLGRYKWAGESSQKQAYKLPKVLQAKKVKNVKHDEIGDQYARIHNPPQDLSKLQTRKMKALKLTSKSSKNQA